MIISDLIHYLVWMPLGVLLFRILFSRRILIQANLLVLALTIGFLLYGSWQEGVLTALTHLPGRFAWPWLGTPLNWSMPALPLLLLTKSAFFAFFFLHRTNENTWWWPLLDCALTLTLGASDPLTLLTWQQTTAAICLLCLARLSKDSSDDYSNSLLALCGVVCIGFTCLWSYTLYETSQSGNFLMLAWLGTLFLSGGVTYQVLQFSKSRLQRQALALFPLCFSLPAYLFVSRIETPLPEITFTLVAVLSILVLLSGLVTAVSRTTASTLQYASLCLQALCGIAILLQKTTYTFQWLGFFAPILALLFAQAFLSHEKEAPRSQWINSLPSVFLRMSATLVSAGLFFLFSNFPFGGLNFPFLALLEVSMPASFAVCLGTLMSAFGIFELSTGGWFSDRFWKWPQSSQSNNNLRKENA